MSPLIKRARGHAMQFIAIGLIGSALVAVGAAGMSIWSRDPGLTRHEAISMLSRAGIDAPTLAAAGVDSAGAALVGTNAKDHLDTNILQLRVAVSTHDALQNNVRDLERLVRAGKATSDQLQSLNTARTTLASAETDLDTRFASLSAAALADASSDQRQRVATINANKGRNVPIEFLVEDRTDQEWLDLRNALAHQRVRTNTGETTDAACAQLIASTNSDPDVANAKTALAQSAAVGNAMMTNLSE